MSFGQVPDLNSFLLPLLCFHFLQTGGIDAQSLASCPKHPLQAPSLLPPYPILPSLCVHRRRKNRFNADSLHLEGTRGASSSWSINALAISLDRLRILEGGIEGKEKKQTPRNRNLETIRKTRTSEVVKKNLVGVSLGEGEGRRWRYPSRKQSFRASLSTEGSRHCLDDQRQKRCDPLQWSPL